MRREGGKLYQEPARRVVNEESVRRNGGFTESVDKALNGLRMDAATMFMHTPLEDGVEFHFVLEVARPEKKT